MSGRPLTVHGVEPVDLARTAAALVLVALVEVGLRTLRLPVLTRLVGVPLDTTAREPRESSEPVIVPRWARRRLSATRRALKYWPFGDTCLRFALVGGFLVRRLEPVVRIGVAIHEGEVKAHAWLEVGGLSLDPGSVDFAPVESIAR